MAPVNLQVTQGRLDRDHAAVYFPCTSYFDRATESMAGNSRSPMDRSADVAHFQTFGFVVLRRAFDPGPLAAEIDRVMHDGLIPSSNASGSAEIRFRYVPMMSTETPVSLSLLDELEPVARALLGGPVLPTRAKGVVYRGDTPAYLEPLGAESGALRVLPGSHRPELAERLRALGAAGAPAEALPAHIVATEPGDLVVFDEHLFHASAGGGARRQWRLDYLPDPVDAEAEEHTRSYFRSIYPPDWNGGYDVDRYPSYGLDWRESGRPSVTRLGALGVYDLAAVQEAFGRKFQW
jgi:hypothetical protein